MKHLPLRLRPGQDLRRALEDIVSDEGCDAAFVLSGIGSLAATRLRLAGANDPMQIDGDVEILTLAGSVSATSSHLHISVADATGVVKGGHAGYGCIVRTTAEVLIALLPEWHFAREVDATMGYEELVVQAASGGAR
jgi:predicted DNA-binding protein with PD1-like motif